MAAVNLRERKKERTRATITRVALELFARDGFHATTINDIAVAADVAPRTVSTYFPSKEGIVFEVYQRSLARFEARLARRTGRETLVDVIRDWLGEEEATQRGLVCSPDGSEADIARLRELAIASDPDLWALQRRYMLPMARMVARAVAADAGQKPEWLPGQLAGEAVVATLIATGAHAARTGGAAIEQFESALEFLHAGLAAVTR